MTTTYLNSLSGLRNRLSHATGKDEIAIRSRIADVEARMSAPDLAHLPADVREEIIEWEGQVDLNWLFPERQMAIRGRIESLKGAGI